MENNRMEKTCSKCGITKLVEDFGTRIRNGKTYVQSPCRDCSNKWRRENGKKWRCTEDHKRYHSNRHLKKTYGVTLEEKEAMLAAQGGCAICGITESKQWAMDHCHETGKVRGVLCPACNCTLGHVEKYLKDKTPWDNYLSAY